MKAIAWCRAGAVVVAALQWLAASSGAAEWTGSLEAFLTSQPERFGAAVEDPRGHRVQVIYTQIDRDPKNRPTFTSSTFRLDAGEYFYPASTVKLPTALLALEKVNALSGTGVARDTAMLTGAADDSQAPATSDPTSVSGLPSVGNYVRRILLVSDNDAFDRLYEFVGQKALNQALHGKGLGRTRVLHRLGRSLSVGENQRTNPVEFVRDGAVLFEQPAVTSDVRYTASAPVLLGGAEVVGGELLDRPKDFAAKNAYPLQDQHDVIQALMFPGAVPESRRFALTDDDYRFVYRCMSMYPGESGIAEYSDREAYPDGYVKFLMFGGGAGDIPDNIRIFNKVGIAYGFLTDAAYVVDFQNRVEFILAATVYANANQIFNDDQYEYDEVGMPFLRELGKAIYEVELGRPRERPPDLERFDVSGG